MSRPAVKGLAHVGRALRRSESAVLVRTRTAALLLGTCLLCLSLAGIGLAVHTHSLHQERTTAVAPRMCAAGEQPTVLYRFAGFTQLHNRPVTVIVVAPLSDTAAPPPGLEAWPSPGEAAVSPAVAQDLTGDLNGLFGTVAEIIHLEGLEVPQERRVYLRPSDEALNTDAMMAICGFGAVTEGGAYAGSGSLNSASSVEVVLLLIGTLFAPALGATTSAAMLRGAENRRRVMALVTVGLRRRDLAVIDLAETWPGLLGGLIVAAALAGLAMTHDVHLAWLDAWFPAADTRRSAPAICGGLLLGAVLAITTVLVCRDIGRIPVRSRGERGVTAHRWSRVLIAAGLIMSIWYPLWNPGSFVKHIVYLAGVLVAAAGLPGLVSDVSSWCGRLLVRSAYRSGAAGRLTAGRHLTSLSARSSHLAVALMLAVLVAGQVQLWSSSLSPQYFQSLEALKRWGEQVAILENTDAATSVEQIANILPEDAEAFSLDEAAQQGASPSDESPVPRLTARCELLTTWGLTCASQEVPTVLLLTDAPVLGQLDLLSISQSVDIVPVSSTEEVLRTAESGATIHILAVGGADLDVRAIERDLNAQVPGVLIFNPPQEWVTGGEVPHLRSLWTVTLGAVGLSVLVLAFGLSIAHESARMATRLAPMGVLAGSLRPAVSAARWRTGVIVLVSGTSATVLYRILPIGMARVTSDAYSLTWQPSGAYILVCLVITCTVTVLSCAVAGRAAKRAAEAWRP